MKYIFFIVWKKYQKLTLNLIIKLLNFEVFAVVSHRYTTRVKTKIGSSKGDGLSPILFVVYLEAAVGEARAQLKNEIILEMIYAEKNDLIVENDKAVKSCISKINKTFQKWNLR